MPKGYPEPGLFQQSVGWVDKDGNGLRYQNIIYSNAYHGMGVYPEPSPGGDARDRAKVRAGGRVRARAPAVAGPGGGAGAGAAIQARQAVGARTCWIRR